MRQNLEWKVFDRPYAFEDGGERIDFRHNPSSGKQERRSLLIRSMIPFLLPDWTQRRVSDEIEEADLLWDERAIVSVGKCQ